MEKGMNEKNFLIAWLVCSICSGISACLMVSIVMKNDAVFPIEMMVIYCTVGGLGTGACLFSYMKNKKEYWGERAKMESVAQILFFFILVVDIVFLANGSNYIFRQSVKNGDVVSCKIEIRRNDLYCMGTSEEIFLKEEDNDKWKDLKNKLDRLQAGSWRARLSKEMKLESICRGNYCFSTDEFLNNKILKTGFVKKEKDILSEVLDYLKSDSDEEK